MKNILSLLFLLSILVSCNSSKEEKKVETKEKTQTEMAVKQYEAPVFSIEEANKLIELPLHCVETEYPNKLGQTIGSDEDLQSPEALHPIFY